MPTPPRPSRAAAERRRRVLAVGVLAALSFAAGAVAGSRHEDGALATAERYARAYERGDVTGMYRELSDAARARTPLRTFAAAVRADAATATALRVDAGRPRKRGDGAVEIPVTVATRVFGPITASLRLPVDGDGDGARIDWRRSMAFPGVPAGARLDRSVVLPTRGTLLTRDGKVLAEGDARVPDPSIADVARNTVGMLGPAPASRRAELAARGVPADAKVGLSGLERALDDRLLGRPGGVLRAGGRVLAAAVARRADPVRTTVSVPVERAAIAALGDRLGGAVVLVPRTGEVLAFAGIAFSGLQPPGSTFKMITATGALQAGLAKPSDVFPVQTAATLEGVDLQNANGESCGGTLAHSFAESCNSVFAPLGVKLGAGRLVATAERFGFNAPPDIAGAATSTLPAPGAIGDDLAVGSTAIGQGRVQATALEMATVAASLGLRGRRPRLTLELDVARRRRAAPTTRVTSPKVARTMEKLMLGVVRDGTGTAAAIPGVAVAGKTGTAELQSSAKCDTTPPPPSPDGTPTPVDPEACSQNDPTDTDAWFAAYAPAGDGQPRAAVGVMLVRSGAGGDTAAPAARTLLLAALKRAA